MNRLYSVTHFKANGMVSNSGTPILIEDDGAITSVGMLQWRDNQEAIDKLKPGLSTVIALQMDRAMVSEGYRVTRLPDFKMNTVYFDGHAKEAVLVSNGFDAGAFRPSEAIALRPIFDGEQVKIAYTHRAVNPLNLSEMTGDWQALIKKDFERVLQADRKDKQVIGRI